jgi:hypothetical protein
MSVVFVVNVVAFELCIVVFVCCRRLVLALHFIFVCFSHYYFCCRQDTSRFRLQNPPNKKYPMQSFMKYFSIRKSNEVRSNITHMISREISWDFMRFHEISWDFMRFHEVSWGFMRFHEISWDHVRSREISWDCLFCFFVFCCLCLLFFIIFVILFCNLFVFYFVLLCFLLYLLVSAVFVVVHCFSVFVFFVLNFNYMLAFVCFIVFVFLLQPFVSEVAFVFLVSHVFIFVSWFGWPAWSFSSGLATNKETNNKQKQTIPQH